MPIIRRTCAPRKFATISPHHSTGSNLSVNMRQLPLIDRYTFYLANARGLAPNTVRAYAGDVGRFLAWLDGEEDDLHVMQIIFLLG